MLDWCSDRPCCFPIKFGVKNVRLVLDWCSVIWVNGDVCFLSQLEAMGFDRAIVLEVYFACNKNEELAANYLLDHMHEFEEQ